MNEAESSGISLVLGQVDGYTLTQPSQARCVVHNHLVILHKESNATVSFALTIHRIEAFRDVHSTKVRLQTVWKTRTIQDLPEVKSTHQLLLVENPRNRAECIFIGPDKRKLHVFNIFSRTWSLLQSRGLASSHFQISKLLPLSDDNLLFVEANANPSGRSGVILNTESWEWRPWFSCVPLATHPTTAISHGLVHMLIENQHSRRFQWWSVPEPLWDDSTAESNELAQLELEEVVGKRYGSALQLERFLVCCSESYRVMSGDGDEEGLCSESLLVSFDLHECARVDWLPMSSTLPEQLLRQLDKADAAVCEVDVIEEAHHFCVPHQCALWLPRESNAIPIYVLISSEYQQVSHVIRSNFNAYH